MTKGDICEILRTSDRTLDRMVERGDFPEPTHRLGARSPRWARDVVEAWLLESRRGEVSH